MSIISHFFQGIRCKFVQDHVPVLSPYYIAVFNLGRAIAEEDVKAHVSCVFGAYDVKSCGFHTLLPKGKTTKILP